MPKRKDPADTTKVQQIAAALANPERPKYAAPRVEDKPQCRIVYQQTPNSQPIWGLPQPERLAQNTARRMKAKRYYWVVLVECKIASSPEALLLLEEAIEAAYDHGKADAGDDSVLVGEFPNANELWGELQKIMGE